MYFFVIFNAIVTIAIGTLMLISGIGVAFAGFLQNTAIVEAANQYLLAGTNIRLLDARFYTSVLGLVLFLSGMATAAVGQLFIVFADMAVNLRDLNKAFKNMLATEQVGKEKPAPVAVAGLVPAFSLPTQPEPVINPEIPHFLRPDYAPSTPTADAPTIIPVTETPPVMPENTAPPVVVQAETITPTPPATK